MRVCRPPERGMSPAGVWIYFRATEKYFLLPIAQLDIALEVVPVNTRIRLTYRIRSDLSYRCDEKHKLDGKRQHFSTGRNRLKSFSRISRIYIKIIAPFGFVSMAQLIRLDFFARYPVDKIFIIPKVCLKL